MKYRIRDFLWLALAVGLGLGWYVDRQIYTNPDSDWVHFDYQYFELANTDTRNGPAPFERTPHTFEPESRMRLFADEGEPRRDEIATAAR